HRPGRLQLRPELVDFLSQLGEPDAAAPPLRLQLEYSLDAGQVDAVFLGQPLHLAQDEDVAKRVAPAPARCPPRRNQAEPVVGAQRLRVQAGKLRGHRDDVYGSVVRQPEVVLHVVASPGTVPRLPGVRHHAWPLRSNSSRGSAPVVASLNFSRALRASSLSWVGTWTSTLTSRSPCVASGLRTPLPRTLKVRPLGVPRAIRRVPGF